MNEFIPRLFFSLALSILLSSAAKAQVSVKHLPSPNSNTDVWLINRPIVNEPGMQSYKNYGVVFKPGDGITVEAGGCVQTGGVGATWKRYVDPRGGNGLYAGTIWIPGVLGNQEPNVTPVNKIIGTRWAVPVDADPTKLFLLLGYLDDGYGDNGYTEHDDGTDDQCKGSVDAWVRITAVRHAGGKFWNPVIKGAPFDLASANYDDNLIMLNPRWAYATDPNHPGVAPVAEVLCAVTVQGTNSNNPGVAYYPDHVPCVSPDTFTERDQADDWITRWFSEVWDDAVCAHANWGPATYSGHLLFESHSTPFDDDDYSWQLYTDGGAGLVGKPSDRQALEPEFNSQETVVGFSSPWWTQLRDTVNMGSDADGFSAAKAMFTDSDPKGKYTIMTGLMGLDLEHNIHAELHPLFAMAVRVKDTDPSDEHWAFFVRRSGDEGFCSSRQHYLDFLPDDQYIFRLPLIWGRQASLADNVEVDFRGETDADPIPVVTFVSGAGVYVTFNMQKQPALKQIIHGEIHLSWNNARRVSLAGNLDSVKTTTESSRASHAGASVLHGQLQRPQQKAGGSRASATGLHDRFQLPQGKASGAEEYYERLIGGLSAAQLAQIRAAVPPRNPPNAAKVIIHGTIKVVRSDTPPRRLRSARHPSVSSQPDMEKIEHDKQLKAAILSVSAPAGNR